MKRIGSLAIVSVLTSTSAHAADDDRFTIGVSVFRANAGTEVRADGSGVGTRIRLEGELGLPEAKTIVDFDAMYRMADRHRLLFDYYDLDRSRDDSLVQADFTFRDRVFRAGTVLDTGFDFRLAAIRYECAIARGERYLVGASAGLFVSKAAVRLESAALQAGEQASASAPLPVVGVRAVYRPGERWLMSAQTEYFKLGGGDIDGHWSRVGVAVERRFGRHFGVSLGYDWFRLKARSEKSNWNGAFDLEIDGLVLGATLAF